MLAKLTLGLLSLALALLLVEFALRFSVELRARSFVGAPVPVPEIVPDPLLVAWHKPNYTTDDGKQSFDARGLRLNGAPRTEPVEHATALLGGSTAYGFGLRDDETIAAYLEQRLRAAAPDDPASTVLNAGYPGLTTLDTLLVYHAKLADLHPSQVIVLAGLNDLYYASDWGPPSQAHRLYWINTTEEVALRARHDPALRPVVDAIDSIALGNCFTCYYLGSVASRAYDAWHAPPALLLAELFGQQPLGQPNARAMRLQGWAIRELAGWVAADGGCLTVAWQPVAGVTAPATTDEEKRAVASVERLAPGWSSVAPTMLAQLKAETDPLFQTGGAQAVDLAHALDGAPGPVWADDGVHYTPLGNRLLAQALLPALQHPACRG